MKRDRKISIFVVLLVVLFTAFFLYEASFLVINGDFTRFFPWDEGSDTYYGGEEGQTPILAMEREEGEVLTDYIISQDYRTGFKAVNGIGLEEEKDYPYTSTMYVLVQSENIWNPEFLDELERAIDEIEERKDSARPESILDSFTISGEDAHLGLIPMSAREGKKWSEEEADVLAGADLRAALADDDAAGGDRLAAIGLHATVFRIAVATVAAGGLTFLMCHDYVSVLEG